MHMTATQIYAQLRPLHDQIRVLKSELKQATAIKSDVDSLKEQVADVRKAQKDFKADLQRVRELEASVSSLKNEIKLLKEDSNAPSRPSTPKPKPGQHRSMPMWVFFVYTSSNML